MHYAEMLFFEASFYGQWERNAKPGVLILHAPMGLKAAAPSGLQVVGIKGPEQRLKGQLTTTELGPSSATQPGRVLGPH